MDTLLKKKMGGGKKKPRQIWKHISSNSRCRISNGSFSGSNSFLKINNVKKEKKKLSKNVQSDAIWNINSQVFFEVTVYK